MAFIMFASENLWTESSKELAYPKENVVRFIVAVACFSVSAIPATWRFGPYFGIGPILLRDIAAVVALIGFGAFRWRMAYSYASRSSWR